MSFFFIIGKSTNLKEGDQVEESGRSTSFLENHGYSCSVERRKRYRGSIEPETDIITAMRDGLELIPTKGKTGQLKFTLLQEILRAVPLAAQIIEVFTLEKGVELALFQKIDGTLIWELEDHPDRPMLESVESAIDSFVHSLRPINLVNADVRPWNIIYRRTDATFHFIDWGFSFFAGGPKSEAIIGHLTECGHRDRPEMEIDGVDMKRTIAGLRDPSNIEGQWGYKQSRFDWRPEPWR